MADWDDWLTGISGGLSGVVKGIDAGMAPFSTWEGIRTKDLANDRSEIGNRDLELMQYAREGGTDYDYYGNVVGAQNVGNRQKIASGERDIYGQQQQLALAQYLSDPEGAFQQGLKETGWTPGTPEYREWLAEAMSMYDPSAATTAYDKMGIPGIENRNLNEQAALEHLQQFVQQKDPGATVKRMPDGTVVVIDSNGEMTPVPGDQMTKLYDRLAGTGGVAGAEDRGIKEMIAIQAANVQLMKAMQDGTITPSMAFKHLQDEGVRINQAANRVATDLRALERVNTDTMDEGARTAHLARIEQMRAEAEQYKMLIARNLQSLNSVIRGGGTPGSAAYGGRPQGGAPWMMTNPITGMPMAGSQGGAAMVTPKFAGQQGRPPIGNVLNRAAGVPGGRPSQALPFRPEGPRNTGVRPITQGNQQMGGLDVNQLIAFLQSMGVNPQEDFNG